MINFLQMSFIAYLMYDSTAEVLKIQESYSMKEAIVDQLLGGCSLEQRDSVEGCSES